MDAAEDGYAGRGKKEILMLTRERTKLERVLGGISDMTKTPSALWIVDTNKEHIAVAEAQKLRIPVVAILDTNCDPDTVNYPIPGNDDAIRSVKLLTHIVGEAVVAGKQQREERQLAKAREAAGDAPANANGQDAGIQDVQETAAADESGANVTEAVAEVEAQEAADKKAAPATPAAAEAEEQPAAPAQDAAAEAVENVDSPANNVDPV